MYCTSGSLTIKIGEYFIVCPRSGGKVEVENFNGYLLCPDYNLICTGSRLCNNIYDCLKEQSVEINETFYYNYTIKTTQNSEVYASEKAIYGYELTQDGNCSYLLVNVITIKFVINVPRIINQMKMIKQNVLKKSKSVKALKMMIPMNVRCAKLDIF